MKRHEIIRSYLLAVMFCLILAFPIVNHYTALLKDISSFENRGLAKLPQLNLRSLDPFPEKYERYYNDHFTLRNGLIKSYSVFKLLLFRESPFPEAIVVGDDKWLYQSADELDVFTGKMSLTQEDMEAFRVEFEYRKAWLQERGCRFYLMIVPCKACIHSEHLGMQYYRMNEQSLGEELVHYLQKNSDIKPLDLFRVLKEKKKQSDVFYRMDTHWNKFGAFCAANAFFETLQKDFTAVQPLELKDVKQTPMKSPDLLKMIGNVNFLKEFESEPLLASASRAKEVAKKGYVPPQEFPYPYMYEYDREIADTSKPRLLVVSDSFGENIYPYLAENFSRSVRIWDSWQYKLNEDIVESEKPGLLLLIIHEKNLKLLLKYRSGPGREQLSK